MRREDRRNLTDDTTCNFSAPCAEAMPSSSCTRMVAVAFPLVSLPVPRLYLWPRGPSPSAAAFSPCPLPIRVWCCPPTINLLGFSSCPWLVPEVAGLCYVIQGTSNVKLCSLSTVFRAHHHHHHQRRSA